MLETSNEASIIEIVLARLISARSNKEWVPIEILFKIKGGTLNKWTIRTALRRLEEKGLITKRLMLPVRALKGRRINHYQANEGVDIVHLRGGLPRSPKRRVLDVLQRHFSDIFDAEGVQVEQMQPIPILLDRVSSRKLRALCSPAKRGDRAKQRVYSDVDFVISISKLGKATLNVRGKDWAESLLAWFHKAELPDVVAKDLLAKALFAMKDLFKRIEYPCIDERIWRYQPRYQLIGRDPKTGKPLIIVELNYSGNKAGLEISGKSDFVDDLAASLTAVTTIRATEKAAKRKDAEEARDDLPGWYK